MSTEKLVRVLAINPGSTSTKIGLFEGTHELFAQTIDHDAQVLADFETMNDQLGYRRDMVLELLREHGVELESIDAFVGRGGGLVPVEGGTYKVDELLLSHAKVGANGIQHPAQLGSQLAYAFAEEAGGRPAFVVNPPDTDELCELARMTGLAGVYRHVHLHALNLKETAIRHAAQLGKRYEDCNFVVCHIGGGISISAHKHGRMIDGNDIVGGEGPMTPTRCGSIPVTEIASLVDAGISAAELRARCMKNGGFVDLLDTSDAREVRARMHAGDRAARRAWEAMLYQIAKWIGAMACVLEGQVDGILLGGGMVHSTELLEGLERRCAWIAPITAYPGEFELEAMAAGAIRVLEGVEPLRTYSGIPAFQGFDNA
ncbi:butyrate kinase [Collinsella sp. zg1085]|uniref:butyrate kinase n=1 Tax=Collinsella sp. zg1085 TaxID=2844380 RepID=UPI001C0D9259|nr:butyrate kinase [Collinsella sp. zg1085]QWT17161.1 butyrate kinase [Collinsella sp. zg1085]